MNFVHLKTTTEFSITQSINLISNITKKASKDGMGAIALTDTNGLYGAVKFYKEARKNGLKPILGIDITIEQDDGNKYQLTLLAKNANGYKKIIEINSRSYVENRSMDNVAAKEAWLSDLEDVIILSGGKNGLIGKEILAGRLDEAQGIAQQMKDYFGDDFYIELQRDGTEDEEKYMDGAVAICSQLNIPPVATHNNYFTNSEDFLAHEARYCIGAKEVLFDIKRKRIFNKDMYFKTQEEMVELFSDLPEALANTVAIAKKCNINLELDKPKLPHFPTPDGSPVNDYFVKTSIDGLEERLVEAFPNVEERNKQREIYRKRLDWELEIIQRMDFPGYFLIVSDFITWAKENDIPVGPGRGSGAGSLVAYSLKITDLDPLPYNLLFERFLNPERVSMPDFDIDFCQSRRGEVIDYVKEKYGMDAVCQIGTFGTMSAKSVVRDVGRTLAYSHGFVDNIAKMINIRPNNPITLKQFLFGDEEMGIQGDEKLFTLYNDEQDVKKLIDLALTIEGVTRQVGTHAGGVVIAPTVLTDFSPTYTSAPDSPVSTQFDKDDVETAGLVKFDFLGLTTLTVIKDAVDLINNKREQNGEPLFDLRKLPLDDKSVYQKIYGQGNTNAIFQFESKGMTSFLQKAQPSRLEDLIAINALYRPGPMDIIPDWLESKLMPENQRNYHDPRLKPVLEETYGFMIYQEQVMQCAQVIAGYSLGKADILRRAMGKKKVEEMAKQRKEFVEGAANNGVGAEKANELFDLMEKFSGYGFNKSHAAVYSYLSFQTAYLKHYHPEEFFTATLNSHIGILDTDKIAMLLDDAKKPANGLTINPPDVNESFYKFSIDGDRSIRYGLGALKRVGEKAAHVIEQEREANGMYTDFYNFLERVGKKHVGKPVMTALINAGAFDSLHPNRAQLLAAVEDGLDYVAKYRKKQMEGTSVLGDALFGDEEAPKKTRKKKPTVELVKPELQDIEPWDELTQLKNEKLVFGHFFSSNPYVTYYTKQLDGFGVALPLAKLSSYFRDTIKMSSKDSVEMFVGGLIEEVSYWKSNKGAFVTITDGTSSAKIMVYSDFIEENKDLLKNDSFVSFRLRAKADTNEVIDSTPSVSTIDEEGNEVMVQQDIELMLSAMQGFNFDKTKKLITNNIFVGSDDEPELIQKFTSICEEFIGDPYEKDAVAILCLPDENGRKSKKHKKIHVKAEPKLFEELTKVFGETWVKASFKKDVDNIVFPEIVNKNKGKKYNGQKKGNKSFSS